MFAQSGQGTEYVFMYACTCAHAGLCTHVATWNVPPTIWMSDTWLGGEAVLNWQREGMEGNGGCGMGWTVPVGISKKDQRTGAPAPRD